MVRHGIHALPVVGARGSLLEIVTTTDIMSAGLHSVFASARCAGAPPRQVAGETASDELSRIAHVCERLTAQVQQLERIRVAAARYVAGGQDEHVHAELQLALEAAGRSTTLDG